MEEDGERTQNSELYYSRIEILGSSLFLERERRRRRQKNTCPRIFADKLVLVLTVRFPPPESLFIRKDALLFKIPGGVARMFPQPQ